MWHAKKEEINEYKHNRFYQVYFVEYVNRTKHTTLTSIQISCKIIQICQKGSAHAPCYRVEPGDAL